MSVGKRTHAIVIGGSLAGLFSARVLSKYFDSVTVVERDKYPNTPGNRPGVPQSRHLHALLLRGKRIVESLFPGISDDLMNSGAIELDAGSDLAWFMPAGWGIRYRSGITALSFSRDLLDFVVRGRIRQIENITLLEETDVIGLRATLHGDRITGVTIREKNVEGRKAGNGIDLEADLVVVASGRSSKLPEWLVQLGYDAPEESYVNANVGYASRYYSIPAQWESDWKAVFLQARPPERTRAGVLFPVEGNRWMVSLMGGDRDFPPVDEQGFNDFMRGLPSSELYEAVHNARALTPISGYRNMENRVRHFEKMRRWPRGLVALGDGVCAFNPVYGQGMTMAAIGAELLDQMIRERGIDGIGQEFQKKLAKENQAPWMLATGEELRFRTTKGAKPNSMLKFMHWYLDRVFELSTRDHIVRQRFFEVHQMIKPPTALFAPGIVLRVLKAAISRFELDASNSPKPLPLRSRTTGD